MPWGTNEHVSSVSSFAAGPPSSPLNGDVWVATEAGSGGEVWQFRYNSGSASTYKWEFVGGPPVYATVGAYENTTTTGSYIDLTTAGPSVTPARAGDYILRYGATMSHTVDQTIVACAVNGSGNPAQLVSSGADIFGSAVVACSRFDAVAASTLLKLKYLNSAAGTMRVNYRFLEVTPVRVI